MEGKIYYLYNRNDPFGKIYIGKTTKSLKSRLTKHRSDYKRYINGKSSFYTCFSLIEDIQDLEISLIDEAFNQEDLTHMEKEYIKTFLPITVNKQYSKLFLN
jgi:predicted GIY-YIG superfamily endonuclease